MYLDQPGPDTVWWQGALVTVKVHKEQTNGVLGIAEGHYWPGFSPPFHFHQNEHEGWFILDGGMRVRIGDNEFEAKAGDFVFGPRGIPHSFKALEKGVRVLVLVMPGGLEQMFLDGGVLVHDVNERPVQAFDLEKLPILMKKYGCEVVGPPMK
jgi:quercetin dioxygenase-like cupin family protein